MTAKGNKKQKPKKEFVETKEIEMVFLLNRKLMDRFN